MFCWVALFGCDDEDEQRKQESKVGVQVSDVAWNPPGCEGKVTSGTATDSNGNKGKVSVSWDYIPAMVITLIALSFVVGVARR